MPPALEPLARGVRVIPAFSAASPGTCPYASRKRGRCWRTPPRRRSRLRFITPGRGALAGGVMPWRARPWTGAPSYASAAGIFALLISMARWVDPYLLLAVAGDWRRHAPRVTA